MPPAPPTRNLPSKKDMRALGLFRILFAIFGLSQAAAVRYRRTVSYEGELVAKW